MSGVKHQSEGIQTFTAGLARGLHERIIGGGVGFSAYGLFDPLDVLKLGTQPLRSSAEGVAILPEDALIFLDPDFGFMVASKLGIGEKGPYEVC